MKKSSIILGNQDEFLEKIDEALNAGKTVIGFTAMASPGAAIFYALVEEEILDTTAEANPESDE